MEWRRAQLIPTVLKDWVKQDYSKFSLLIRIALNIIYRIAFSFSQLGVWLIVGLFLFRLISMWI